MSSLAVTTVLAAIILGVCIVLLSVRSLLRRDARPLRTCGGVSREGRDDCGYCPSRSDCESEQAGYDPKSSNAMFSRGTPKSPNMRKHACSIGGGPQR